MLFLETPTPVLRNGSYMFGYLIQIRKQNTNKEITNKAELVDGFDKITITLHSKETNEIGKGEYFVKRIGKKKIPQKKLIIQQISFILSN